MPAICELSAPQETRPPSENDRRVDLLGLQEIADLFGISKQLAYAWARREDFPAPVAELSQGRVWRKRDLLKWAEKYEPAKKRLG